MAAPVEEWTVGGTALTSLMDVERRHGIVNVNLFTSSKSADMIYENFSFSPFPSEHTEQNTLFHYS